VLLVRRALGHYGKYAMDGVPPLVMEVVPRAP